jgi:hypothetical protein
MVVVEMVLYMKYLFDNPQQMFEYLFQQLIYVLKNHLDY